MLGHTIPYTKRRRIPSTAFLYAEEYDNPALYLERLIEYKALGPDEAAEQAAEKAAGRAVPESSEPLAVGKYFVFAVKRGDHYEVVQRTEQPLVRQQMCIQGGRRFVRRTIQKKDDETVFQVDLEIVYNSPLYELRYTTGGTVFHKTEFSFVDPAPCMDGSRMRDKESQVAAKA